MNSSGDSTPPSRGSIPSGVERDSRSPLSQPSESSADEMLRISSSSSDDALFVRTRSRSSRSGRSYRAMFGSSEDRAGPSRSRRPVRRPASATIASRALALSAAIPQRTPGLRPAPPGDEYREGSGPYCPWEMPPVAWKSPLFRPRPRDFEPRDVQYPLDMVKDLPAHKEAIGRFHDALVEQHRAYVRRHAELIEQVEKMEMGMRRLEADPEDWERFELSLIHPMPDVMVEWCRAKRARRGAGRRGRGGR